MARAGQYLEAEGLLAPLGVLPDSAQELDLLARMAARQGRYEQARRLWLSALRTAPDNADYQSCLEALEQMERRRMFSYRCLLAMLWATLLLSAALMGATWFRQSRSLPSKAQPNRNSRMAARGEPVATNTASKLAAPAKVAPKR